MMKIYEDPYSKCPLTGDLVTNTASIDKKTMYVECSGSCNQKENCEQLELFGDIVYSEASEKGVTSIKIINVIEEKIIEEPAII